MGVHNDRKVVGDIHATIIDAVQSSIDHGRIVCWWVFIDVVGVFPSNRPHRSVDRYCIVWVVL